MDECGEHERRDSERNHCGIITHDGLGTLRLYNGVLRVSSLSWWSLFVISRAATQCSPLVGMLRTFLDRLPRAGAARGSAMMLNKGFAGQWSQGEREVIHCEYFRSVSGVLHE